MKINKVVCFYYYYIFYIVFFNFLFIIYLIKSLNFYSYRGYLFFILKKFICKSIMNFFFILFFI